MKIGHPLRVAVVGMLVLAAGLIAGPVAAAPAQQEPVFDDKAALAELARSFGKAPSAGVQRLAQTGPSTDDAGIATICYVAAGGPSMIATNQVRVAYNVSCDAPVNAIEITVLLGRDNTLVGTGQCAATVAPVLFAQCVAPEVPEINCLTLGHYFQGVARVRVWFLTGEPRFLEGIFPTNVVQINCFI